MTCKHIHFCVAVGTFDNAEPLGQMTGPATNLTLVEMWDGHNWTITPSPNVPNSTGDQYNELSSVSCPTTTDCMAAGATGEYSYGEQATLIENWNGASWSVQGSPSPNANSGLTGVSCTSVRNCVAAGDNEIFSTSVNQQPQTLTLIETWNGTSWSVTPSPNITTYANTSTASHAKRRIAWPSVRATTTAANRTRWCYANRQAGSSGRKCC